MSRATDLECVAGEGHIGDGHNLGIGLPNLKVLEYDHGWRGQEGRPCELSPHHNLHMHNMCMARMTQLHALQSTAS